MSTKLLFAPSNMVQLIEYGARTCYNSFDKSLDKHPYEFIQGLVGGRHHESIAAHGYAIIKIDKTFASASAMLRLMTLNLGESDNGNGDFKCHINMSRLVEKKKAYYLSINMRSLRTLVKLLKDKNVVVDDIIRNVIPLLPSCLFSDLLPEIKDNRHMYHSGRMKKFTAIPISIGTDLYELGKFCAKMHNYAYMGLHPPEGELTTHELSKLVNITFHVIGPRWLLTQINRHALAISQESLRYTDPSGDVLLMTDSTNIRKFKCNVTLDNRDLDGRDNVNDKDGVHRIEDAGFHTIEKLVNLISNKMALDGQLPPEVIRDIYPLSIKSEALYTGSMDLLNHIFALRTAKATQKGTRDVFTSLYSQLTQTSPVPVTKMVIDLRKR